MRAREDLEREKRQGKTVEQVFERIMQRVDARKEMQGTGSRHYPRNELDNGNHYATHGA